MDKNLYLYYSLNRTHKSERTSKKSQVKSISIVHVPTHISIRILKNVVTPEGFVLPSCQKIVAFPEHNPDVYLTIKKLLFPSLNHALALQNVENGIEVIRNIAVAIIRQHATQKRFDDWLAQDKIEYTCLR